MQINLSISNLVKGVLVLLLILNIGCEKPPLWMQDDITNTEVILDTMNIETIIISDSTFDPKSTKIFPTEIIKDGVSTSLKQIDSLGQPKYTRKLHNIYQFKQIRFAEHKGVFELLDVEFANTQILIKTDKSVILQDEAPFKLFKKAFPQSYLWRNSPPNIVQATFSSAENIEAKRWSSIILQNSTGSLIHLYFIDNKLKYLIRSL